jgi:hypothetical protein
MKEVLPSLIFWACGAGTRDFCSALAALVGPVQIFFLVVHIFNSFVPITQQAGKAAMLGHLSLSLCLWSLITLFLARNMINIYILNKTPLLA